MSSKRVKRETVGPITPIPSEDDNNISTECERLRKEVNHKNEVITSLEDFLSKMQKGLCCGVCTELLYQPFNLICGHVFCYSCLVDWLKEAKRCPTCRERVVEKPVVSYLIKEIVNSFVRRAEIVDPEGTGARFSKEQQEADKAVRDADGNLFPGLFLGTGRRPPDRIVDQDDGVLRCIRCNWEVEGPTCTHCGWMFSDDEEGFDFSDFDEDGGSSDDDDDDDDESGEDEEDEAYFSPDDSYNASYGSDTLYSIATSIIFSESELNTEEEIQMSQDEDNQSEPDDEADSFVDTRSDSRILEDEMDLDTDDSTPYYIRRSNYYDPLDSSTDYGNYDSDESEEEEEEDEEDEDKDDEDESQDEESDHTIREAIRRSVQRSIQSHSPQNRSHRRGRNVVDSDED